MKLSNGPVLKSRWKNVIHIQPSNFNCYVDGTVQEN